MSAVRGDEPTGTTADKMCQSPKRDSWVTTVLVDEVMSEGDEDSMSSFSQPESAKSTDIQRIKILKYLQMGGVKRMMPIWRQACGLSLRCRWYIFDWHSSLLFTFYKAQKYKDFLKRQKILDIFLRNVEIKGIFVVMTNYCRDFTLYKSVFQLRLPWGGAVLHKVKTLQRMGIYADVISLRFLCFPCQSWR